MGQVVIQTAFIGDLLLAIPLLRAVRSLEPSEPLHLVCREGLGGFFLKLKLVDVVHEIKKGDTGSYKKVIDSLKGQTFSRVICPHESFRSAWLAREIQAQEYIGFKKWWNILHFKKRVERPMHLPDALRQMSLLDGQNILWWPEFKRVQNDPTHRNTANQNSLSFNSLPLPSWASMAVTANSQEAQGLLDKYRISGPFVALAPGSIWATKRWPYFVELAEKLLASGKVVVLIGGREDEALGSEIAAGLKISAKMVNVIGKTNLYESFLILSQADQLVCNDSGVMHLGSVAAVPTIGIFGPTTLTLGYRPWNQNSSVAQQPLACRPCGAHGHNRCPIGTHECMKTLSADKVFTITTK